MSIFRGFGTHSFKYVIPRAGFRHGRIVRAFFVYVCVLLVLPAISTAQSIPDPAQSVDTRNSSEVELEQAVTLALDHSLELASIRARSDAIRAASSYAGALPDPTLSLNAMNMPTDTFSFDQEPMTQMQVALSQSFPFPGKRNLRLEAVE